MYSLFHFVGHVFLESVNFVTCEKKKDSAPIFTCIIFSPCKDKRWLYYSTYILNKYEDDKNDVTMYHIHVIDLFNFFFIC